MPSAENSIAIVGAGMSGLTCGAALTAAGCAVTVFDKGRRPGGRMSTREPSEDQAFDHGCQYFAAESDEFAHQIRLWQSAGVVDEWRSPIVRFHNGQLAPSSSRPKFVGTPQMQSLCQYLADGMDVRCGAHVTAVMQRDDGWLVETGDEQRGVFDQLILAMPPVQTQRLLSDQLSLVDEPWSDVSMTACWTLMAVLSQPSLILHDAIVFHEHSALTWAARNSSKPGRPDRECWVIQASPEWSARHLELPKHQAAEQLTTQFVQAFQGQPVVERATAHRWRFALPTQPALPSVGRTRYLPAMRLGICGDWCEGNRVEAAWRSGKTLAKQMLQSGDVTGNA